MLGTVILPVTVKKWLSISLREVHLLCKFGKPSSSRGRNMTDRQNHMTMLILCHQHLRRIALRHFTKRCICCLSFMNVPPLEKESSGLLAFMKFLQQSILPDLLFHCFSEDSSFETKLDGRKFFCQFSVQFCVANVISFSYNKEPLMRKTELSARETFVNKVISSVDP